MQLGIFPGDGGASFDLRPGDLGAIACALASLCHKVVNAARACFRIARIPVLDGGVFDLGIIKGDQFYNCGMELIFV